MKTTTEANITIAELRHLPSFAQYLLQHRLEDVISFQLMMFNEMDIPLFRFFRDIPEAEFKEITREGAVEILAALSNQKATEYIESSIEKWRQNQLPIVGKHEVVAEDITMVTYMRKKLFLHFIQDYSKDIEQVVQLVQEIDLFLVTSETAFTTTYINLLKEKIDEDSILIEKVNATIPGAVYVYDVENKKGIFSNNKLADIIGYNHEELNELGDQAISKLLHPDDIEPVKKHLAQIQNAGDKEIIRYNYRIRVKDGSYRWLSTHEAVFKRDEKGSVQQTIGFTVDIDKEQQISEALKEKDNLHRQAEAITHIGNYTWNVLTNELKWSDELYRIYELEPGSPIDFTQIESFNDPDDSERIRNQTRKAIEQHEPFDLYYSIRLKQGREKIVHARGNFVEDGSSIILGTVQDVTEKQNLIGKLKHTESVYKQAEELANMGTWSWNLKDNSLQWTDQLYRIYGLEPQSETLSIERFHSFVHPDDREKVLRGTDLLFRENKVDITFSIITADKKIKILRSVAQVQKDGKGQPVNVIGTERDVKEKQTLISRLRRSENLYKQAQSLAHLGNWSWDIETNKIEWSDELYRIFGLEPASLEIDFEKYLQLIHPDDRLRIRQAVEEALNANSVWEFTHRLIRTDGAIRFVYATGEVLVNSAHKPYMLMGTAQDITERQVLIEKLQESEKLFKQAQSLSKLGNWTLNILTGEITWSDQMYSIFEMEPGTTMNFQKWLDLMPADEQKTILEYYHECLREKKTYDRIHRVHLKNGIIKTVHRKGELILDEGGNPVRMVGTTQDISEEYRVQQELKENQMFIQKITDATPSIISSYNVHTGQYVYISEGVEKLLGYHREEIREQGVQFFIDIVHPEDLPQLTEKNATSLTEANADPNRNDMVIEFIYRMKHKNGNYRWFHTYGTIFDRNEAGQVEHLLNISLDVTDQIEATQKIKEQEHFIQQIADASPTILYLFNVISQKIEYINREIFFVLGYLPEEILDAGTTITELLYHPEDFNLLPGRKESEKTFQQVDSMMQYECRMKNKEGEYRWLLVREIVFQSDENGKITQVLGAALDINRRKDMERTILQNTMLLEQSNASLEEFAYVASHDLKEPLRKISTFGDRLVATQLENFKPEGKVYLQKIIDASQRMQTMINDLLSISMISGNTAYENYSLQKIFEETVQTLEYKIEQLNAVITADPLPVARIIPSQFRQLFQNLLSNSLKFIRPDVLPRITITYSLQPAAEMRQYQLAHAERYHKIRFSDNGIGFEKEYAGKIFAIFQRLHGRSEFEGSGIGLAICKKIVEHHGGIIFASGIPDEGATFTIILPA